MRSSSEQMIVASLPCVLLALMIHWAWPVTIDDAFISLRHAYNLASHGNLSFDPVAQRIEGYSNFSLVIFEAVLLKLGLEPVAIIKLLGALCALACVPLVYGLARLIGVSHGFALFGALLLALSSGFAFWSVSGLETSLYTLLLTSGVVLFLRRTRACDLAAAFVFALAALTRFEAPILLTAVAAQRALVERLEGRRISEILRSNLNWALLFLLLYGAYFIWRYHYFGHLFPNPIYFKRVTSLGALGESHSLGFVRAWWPFLLLAVVSLGSRNRRNLAPMAVVAAAMALFLNSRILILEDVSTMGFFDRYFVPIFPCLIASAMLGLELLWKKAAERRLARFAVLACGVGLLGWQIANPSANLLQVAVIARDFPPAVAVRTIPAANYLQERFGPEGRIAVGDVGRTGYHFKGSVYDLFGLTSYDFTLRFDADMSRYAQFILEQEPDAIIICYAESEEKTCHHAQGVMIGTAGFREKYRATRSFGKEELPGAYWVIYERRDLVTP